MFCRGVCRGFEEDYLVCTCRVYHSLPHLATTAQIAKRNPTSEQALQSMTIPGLSNRHRSAYGADIVHALAAARAWVTAQGPNAASAAFELDVSLLPSTTKAAKRRRGAAGGEGDHGTQGAPTQEAFSGAALAFDGMC